MKLEIGKVYHTKTMEDFVALLLDAEEQGFTWGGMPPTDQASLWFNKRKDTCVNFESKNGMSYCDKDWYIDEHDDYADWDLPIIPYKRTRYTEFLADGVAYRCSSPEAAESFMQQCFQQGIEWADGTSTIDTDSGWDIYFEKTCYGVVNGRLSVGGIESYLGREPNFTIEDYLPPLDTDTPITGWEAYFAGNWKLSESNRVFI